MTFFRYAGGKTKLKEHISECIRTQTHGQMLQYREPFFGGGSIGLHMIATYPDITSIWINDKDIGMACLWSSVINAPQALKDMVMAFVPSVQHFYDFKNELLALVVMPSDTTAIGFKKLAIHQISYSGLGTKSGGPLGGVKQESDYTIDCRWSPKTICKKIDMLHQQFSRVAIYNQVCTNLDFGELISDTSHEAFIYLDPPYYVKGNALYQCGFTHADHERLATLLKATPHKWLLSYDDCPEIRSLYEWADCHSVDVKYSITALKEKSTGVRTPRTKPELLIYPKKMV